MEIVVHETLRIPEQEIEISHARSGGPGGQNVNKVNTKVHLRWLLSQNQEVSDELRNKIHKCCASYLTKEGDLLVSSTSSRSQSQNLEDCIEKLRMQLLKAFIVKKRRKKTKASKRSIERRIQNKKKNSQKKKNRSKVRDY